MTFTIVIIIILLITIYILALFLQTSFNNWFDYMNILLLEYIYYDSFLKLILKLNYFSLIGKEEELNKYG